MSQATRFHEFSDGDAGPVKLSGRLGSLSRVLIIDDEEINLQLLRAQLGSGNYEVELARGGAAGLNAARANPPDLILLDLIMPGFTGVEVVAQLKASESTHAVPVLLITSSDARRDKLRGLLAGADDFLTRPIDAAELLARVRSLLRGKRLHDQLQALNHELEQRVEQRTSELAATANELEAFAYSISHDLRAPLRGISGFSQALIDEYASTLDATATRYVIRIQLASQRMSHMIDDLLKLSRVARIESRQEVVNLSAIAESVFLELRHLEPARDVQISIEPGLVASGDPGLLRLALQNLLDNAWKFTRPRTPGCITFGLMQREQHSMFFIRDNGVGFDMTYAGKLFGAFQRLHDSSEFEGTGIGLATVQRVIQRHGGRIWAESSPDVGTTFWFTLKRLEVDPDVHLDDV